MPRTTTGNGLLSFQLPQQLFMCICTQYTTTMWRQRCQGSSKRASILDTLWCFVLDWEFSVELWVILVQICLWGGSIETSSVTKDFLKVQTRAVSTYLQETINSQPKPLVVCMDQTTFTGSITITGILWMRMYSFSILGKARKFFPHVSNWKPWF